MPSSILDSDYYRDMFGTAAMRRVWSDEQRVQAWLDVEVALARAEEEAGIIPPGTASGIAHAARLENLDLDRMKDEFDRIGFPVLPFVHQLAAACEPEVARWVHYGATTQDIIDTGMVLQIRDGLVLVERDLEAIIDALTVLARDYRNTVMAGRTFQQLAAPITFGFKAAVWLDEMMRHRQRLVQMKERVLVGQCAGAVGTFATLGAGALEVQRHMMRELDLATPTITWHTARDRWAELIANLAMLTASLGKIAAEIAILMRSEVGELSEPFEVGRGASTTLPQKRNPISCQPVLAIADKMRGLVGSQLSAMMQEHERGVGHMHLEWMVIPEAFVLTSGSLHHARFVLENLQVDPHQMRENLQLGGGLLMSEAVMMGLAPRIGRHKAHAIVSKAAGRAMDDGTALREALVSDPEVTKHLSVTEIDTLLDPANYTGSAGEMVDAVLALAAHREED